MEFLFVGLGGVLGSLARFSLGQAIGKRSRSQIPIATFIINITGALFLGIVNSMNFNRSVNLLLAEGFLGAYTTFSTFMYEGFNLCRKNRKFNAGVYILLSLAIGTIGFFIGSMMGVHLDRLFK